MHAGGRHPSGGKSITAQGQILYDPSSVSAGGNPAQDGAVRPGT